MRCLFKNIDKYSKRINKKISINNLLKFKGMTQGNRSRMLNEDLKGRLAEKIIEIENFPNGISMMPSVQKVNKWYIQSFRELTDVDVHKSEEYTKTLEGIYNRHSSTLMTFANGIIEYKKHLNGLFNNEIVNGNNVIGYNDNFNILEYLEMNKRGERINNYLDMFYTNRISIRLLISHYLELEKGCDQVGYNGIVSLNEPLTYTIEEAIKSSQQVRKHETSADNLQYNKKTGSSAAPQSPAEDRLVNGLRKQLKGTTFVSLNDGDVDWTLEIMAEMDDEVSDLFMQIVNTIKGRRHVSKKGDED